MSIEDIIDKEVPFIDAVECDGAVRIFHYRLMTEQIPHYCFIGTLSHYSKPRINVHMWIKLEDGRILDHKARMWAGPTAPHGIFHPSEFPDYYYSGEEVIVDVSENLYKILKEEKSILEYKNIFEKRVKENRTFRND